MHHHFLLWVFSCYCDGDSYHTNYGRANNQTEYGISQADFMNEHEDKAIEDAKDFLARHTVEQRKEYVSKWRNSCYQRAASLTEMANTEFEV